jgi:integrase
MGQNGSSAGGLVLASTNSREGHQVAGYLVSDASVPAVAVYLGRLTPNTRGPARYRLERVAEFLSGGRETMYSMPWHHLNKSGYTAVRVWLERVEQGGRGNAGKLLSPGARNNYLVNLRGVLAECVDMGLMDGKVLDAIKRVPMFTVPKHGARPGRHVELDEVRRLVASIAKDERPVGRRDAAIVAVLFGSGLRRAEVAALTVDDLGEGKLTVRCGKGGKSRVVPLPEWVSAAVARWLDVYRPSEGSLPLFISYRGCTWAHGGQHMRPTSLRDILDARLEAAGFDMKSDQGAGSRFRCHDARRTYIGQNIDEGTPITTVAELVGHSDVRTTQLYDRAAGRRMVDAVAKLPDPFS